MAEASGGGSAPPTLDELRRRSGLRDDDDLVLAAMFEPDTLAALYEARDRRHLEGRAVPRAGTPLDELVREIERRPSVRWIRVRKNEFTFERGAAADSNSGLAR